MIECINCAKYHKFSGKLMCEAGIWEILIIGPVMITTGIESCASYDEIKALEETKKLGRPRKNA